MGKEYLIDSNAIIDFFNGTMNNKGTKFISDIEARISIITQIEIFGYPHISPSEHLGFSNFLDSSIVYDVNSVIADKTISLRSLHKIKLPDAIIAATALCYNLTLITHNISDFKKITNLKLLDPYTA